MLLIKSLLRRAASDHNYSPQTPHYYCNMHMYIYTLHSPVLAERSSVGIPKITISAYIRIAPTHIMTLIRGLVSLMYLEN